MTNDMIPPPHDSMEEAQMAARWWPQEAEPATVRIAAPAGAQAEPDGDADMPVVKWLYTERGPHALETSRAYDDEQEAARACELFNGQMEPLVRQRDAHAAIASRDERIAGLEADLREEQDRRQAMRNEWSAEVAALTAQARHAEDCLDAAKARIAELGG